MSVTTKSAVQDWIDEALAYHQRCFEEFSGVPYDAVVARQRQTQRQRQRLAGIERVKRFAALLATEGDK